jgi:nucleoside-diphosphate-sugar epimerase
LLTVVTGAAGFVGQALVRRMVETGYAGQVRLVDRIAFGSCPAGFETLVAELDAPGSVEALLAGADRVVHLAALPGGAAERDPLASRRVNLDFPLMLLERLAAAPRRVRLVLASSIAVFGASLPQPVDDETPSSPDTSYGVHKAMTELAVADAARRGLNAVAMRLPGIVARPRGDIGFKSGFASDLFWAIGTGERLTLPVSAEATMWLISARCAADNLLHALTLSEAPPPVLTLPALRVKIVDLVAEAARATGNAPRIRYDPEPAIEAAFGRLPELRTPAADALGFRHDGSLEALVQSALQSHFAKEIA